ncbi:uncharacterized protein LOC114357436 isoform X2 [Ostrinia furnacalis]|uniref:uncharacterized protein LOC114357436 isoform X2 n=1 Tax=Ostrinia furnacalis TaxID=93504 RepID=UPI00103869E3|nr:uncharacterized protein LOC114357436 isoform X2 [Ostrinia furnacalis]
MREGFIKQGVPESAVEVMLSSISENTKSQYSSSLKQWWEYTKNKKCDFYDVSLESLLDFLTECMKSGSSYGTLNNHRSAISLISSNKIGQNDTIKRFFKGVFKLRPSFPRYNFTWNPNVVLNYVETLFPNESISLQDLTKKLVILLALATGQRIQTISLIKTKNIYTFTDRIVITITDLIKTSGVGRQQPTLNLPFFTQRPAICPASCLQTYIKTSELRRTSNVANLLLTYKKPYYRAATTQTIRRWVKDILESSGIDTTIFNAHSTRHASTSAASRAGVSLDIIRKCAGWSEQSETFANFYNRPVLDCNPSLINIEDE